MLGEKGNCELFVKPECKSWMC